jgi:hypothetical protein
MVKVAVAGDVTDAEIGYGEDDSVTISVPEESVEQAQDAIEAMTEPEDVIGEP